MGEIKMNIMTKRGSQDNVVTYEHYCDTKADLDNIPQDKITLGSVAIVLKDEGNEMGIYIANSNKEWISFSTGGSGGENSMSDISLANLVDVSLANPNDGDTLVYDGTTNKWIAQANNNADVLKITFSGTTENPTSSATYQEIMDAINADKIIIGKSVGFEHNNIYNFFIEDYNADRIFFRQYYYVFFSMDEVDAQLMISEFVIDNQNNVTYRMDSSLFQI